MISKKIYVLHANSNSFKTFIHLNKHRYIKEGERIKNHKEPEKPENLEMKQVPLLKGF